MIGIEHYLVVSSILFVMGVLGIIGVVACFVFVFLVETAFYSRVQEKQDD